MTFQELQPKVSEIISETQLSRDEKLQAICQLLNENIAHYNWVGFYFANHEDKTLHLGPYVGAPTDHTVIPFGKGICGQVAESNANFVVPDVAAQDNYIACSFTVKSEIVVPLFVNGINIGQIDIDSHVLDPFTADSTIIVFCDVYDIYKGEMYEKCPRSIAKKAVEYLAEANIGDVAYFGPENEFFIFDDVKIIDSVNESYFKVDCEDGEWNDAKNYEGGNIGHRARLKGGYFPVAPIDNGVDLRAEMMQVLEQVGLEVVLGHHEVAQGQHELGVVFGDLIEASDNVQKLKYVIKYLIISCLKFIQFLLKILKNIEDYKNDY